MPRRLPPHQGRVAALALGCAGALTLAACVSNPPQGSLEALKRDQAGELYRECCRHPDAYGYPYTLFEYLRLPLELNAQLVNPSLYCHRAVRTLVR
jgi:hypothetical protein